MKFEDLFQVHEPPPGGLEDLRRRIGSQTAGRHPRFPLLVSAGLAAAAAALAALLLVPAMIRHGQPDPLARLASLHEDPSMVRFGLTDMPDEIVTLPRRDRGRIAVLPVSVGSEEVLLYWVVRVTPDEGKNPDPAEGTRL